MSQIKYPIPMGELKDYPLTRNALQILQNNLQFDTYTPVLTNVNKDFVSGAYQTTGKLCFVMIRLSYNPTNANWTANPFVTLPRASDPTSSFLFQPAFQIVDTLNQTLIGFGTGTTVLGVSSIQLPVYAHAAPQEIYISGHYWMQ